MRWLIWFNGTSWEEVSGMEGEDLIAWHVPLLPEGTVWFLTTSIGREILRDMGVIN